MLKNPFIAFLKLIRIENLIIISLTQYCVQYFVLQDVLSFTKFTPFLFTISLLSTLLIASAGYIINDYFDVKTDQINRPETVVLDVVIKRRVAMLLHIVFNMIGLFLGLYLALKCHKIILVFFQIFSIILLWFYSTHFKKQLLVGNLVVSFLTATIPLLPFIYDFYFAIESSPLSTDLAGLTIKSSIYIVFGYSLFAFLTSYVREVIKDMEDFKGDVQTGCKTMPIVWGMLTSKVVVFFVIVLIIIFLLIATIHYYKYHDLIKIYYIITFAVLPLLIVIFKTVFAKTSKDFKSTSLLLKFVMLAGICFTVLFYIF
ncbi:MAG: geranylgeranylglycerol-phosphate geranylgeranyltransferase [Bacteroidota bacterium]